MCYSAQIHAHYKKYVRRWGSDINIQDFVRLYWNRAQGAKLKIPKAVDAMFAEPENDDEPSLSTVIHRA